MSNSLQKTAGKIRKPWVHIQYDLDKNGAIQKTELPFVLAVLGNFHGMNESYDKFKDRIFTELKKGKFDDFLSTVNPTLSYSVNNKILFKLSHNIVEELMKTDKELISEEEKKFLNTIVDIIYLSEKDFLASIEGKVNANLKTKLIEHSRKELPVNLSFQSMMDFEPENIISQIPSLNKLLTIRKRLEELKKKINRNENIKDQFIEIMSKSNELKKVAFLENDI